MFKLQRPVAQDSSVNIEDIIKVKSALVALGEYKNSADDFTFYPGRKLFHAIKSFQDKHHLKVDGVMKPDGETQEKIDSELSQESKNKGAFSLFAKNYQDMRDANTIGADKYFHCKANFEASQQGWLGYASAAFASNMREAGDLVKGVLSGKGVVTSTSDTMADQDVNLYGRQASASGKFSNAKEACAIFRPEGLDDKY